MSTTLREGDLVVLDGNLCMFCIVGVSEDFNMRIHKFISFSGNRYSDNAFTSTGPLIDTSLEEVLKQMNLHRCEVKYIGKVEWPYV
jgi:hypothetical protein